MKRTERNNGGVTAWTDRYLDFRLIDPAPEEVVNEISEERAATSQASIWADWVTSRSRNHHVPISMPDEKLLRLAWLTGSILLLLRSKNTSANWRPDARSKTPR